MFLWRLVQNKLSTRDNLKKIGLLRIDGDRCLFGCEEGEYISHLFYNCSCVNIIWFELFKWLEVPSNLSRDVALNFESVAGLLGRGGATGFYLACIWTIMAWATLLTHHLIHCLDSLHSSCFSTFCTNLLAQLWS